MNSKIVLVLFFLLISNSLFSENLFTSKYNFLSFGGLYVNSDLAPISLRGDIAYKPSYLWGIGINREFNQKFSVFNFELEGILGRHTGAMNHYEAAIVAIARVNNIYNSPVSLAFGEGQSYASQNPKLENLKKGFDRGGLNFDDIESRPLLNYLLFEVDYSIPKLDYDPKVFIRLHHRSGIYGVYCSPHPPCGSNFIVYGLRISI